MADTLREAGENVSQPDDINEAIDELLDKPLMDNYAEEFAHVLDLLKSELEAVETAKDERVRLIETENGNTAVAVPEYDDGELSDSEMQALADETNSDEVAMIVLDGEPGILEG